MQYMDVYCRNALKNLFKLNNIIWNPHLPTFYWINKYIVLICVRLYEQYALRLVTTSCCARCIVFEIWQQKRFKQSYLYHTLHRVWYLYPQFILYTEFDICTPSLYSTQSLISVPPVYTLHKVGYMYPQFILYTKLDICAPSLYSTQSLISVPPVYTLHKVWYLYPQFILDTKFDICTRSLYSTQSLISVPAVYSLHKVWYMYTKFILYTKFD